MGKIYMQKKARFSKLYSLYVIRCFIKAYFPFCNFNLVWRPGKKGLKEHNLFVRRKNIYFS